MNNRKRMVIGRQLMPYRRSSSLSLITVLLVMLVTTISTPLMAQQGYAPRTAEREASRMASLGRLYFSNKLRNYPELAYFRGIESESHDGLTDNSPKAIGDFETYQGWMLVELRTVNEELLRGRVEWITYVYMIQDLRAALQLKDCQNHLWGVNQMGGWHTLYPRLAEMQPVGDEKSREEALVRWQKFPEFIDQEIQNLGWV